MVAFTRRRFGQSEQFLGELVETALSAIRAAGVGGDSSQIELDLYAVLRGVFARQGRRHRLFWPAREALPLHDRLLAELADVAYQVALRHGVQGPFLDVELAIWDGFHAIAVDTSTPLPAEVDDVIAQLCREFAAANGREPGSDDLMLVDMPDPEQLEAMLVDDMAATGMAPALVDSFEKTSKAIANEDHDVPMDAKLTEWAAAIEEFATSRHAAAVGAHATHAS